MSCRIKAPEQGVTHAHAKPMIYKFSLVLVAAFLCAADTSAEQKREHVVACNPPLSARIMHSCVVSPGILMRGARPEAAGAASLVALGVRTIVNLELLHNDFKAFHLARPDNVLASRLNYFHIPEWEPNVLIAPSLVDAHVAEFLAIIKTQPKPVFVHCTAGKNRTGVMVAAYRVLLEGWSRESAIAEMGKYEGMWFKADSNYIMSITGRHRADLESAIQSGMQKMRPKTVLECSVQGCNPKQGGREDEPGGKTPGLKEAGVVHH